MSDEKEKWIEEVFQSMEGSQRAKPQPELLNKITNRIAYSKSTVVPLSQWRYAAVAAALILGINITGLIYYNQAKQVYGEDVAAMSTYNQELIRSFQIYE